MFNCLRPDLNLHQAGVTGPVGESGATGTTGSTAAMPTQRSFDRDPAVVVPRHIFNRSTPGRVQNTSCGQSGYTTFNRAYARRTSPVLKRCYGYYVQLRACSTQRCSGWCNWSCG